MFGLNRKALFHINKNVHCAFFLLIQTQLFLSGCLLLGRICCSSTKNFMMMKQQLCYDDCKAQVLHQLWVYFAFTFTSIVCGLQLYFPCCVYRLGIHGDALRIEKLLHVSKDGRNPLGCPIAKWVSELHYYIWYSYVYLL